MSNKSRRDITLGEMQDECKRVKGMCVDGCKVIDVCPNRCDVETRPSKWDLSDPPRFTEAQMALLRGLWDIGARSVKRGTLGDFRFGTKDFDDEIATVEWEFLLREYDDIPLDLAELLEKDGAE